MSRGLLGTSSDQPINESSRLLLGPVSSRIFKLFRGMPEILRCICHALAILTAPWSQHMMRPIVDHHYQLSLCTHLGHADIVFRRRIAPIRRQRAANGITLRATMANNLPTRAPANHVSCRYQSLESKTRSFLTSVHRLSYTAVTGKQGRF